MISVPTVDDDLDEADQTVRVTLTGVTGGATIDQFSRTATGIVRDDDPFPTVGITQASLTANRLRFTVELSAESGRDVLVSYTTSLGTSGRALITAGETRDRVDTVIDRTRLAGRTSLQLRLTSAQNATIDPQGAPAPAVPRRRGVAVPHHQPRRGHPRADSRGPLVWAMAGSCIPGTPPPSAGWSTPPAPARTPAWRPGWPSPSRAPSPMKSRSQRPDWAAASRSPCARAGTSSPPDPDAIGTTSAEFTRAEGGASAVIFDPMLVDCEAPAGVLVIYTYDQSDPQAQNGFRIALPCHPEAQAEAGIPAIASIDANDTIYAYFYSTTPVNLQYANGQYSPA